MPILPPLHHGLSLAIPTMEHFPVEILGQVCSHCTFETLKNLRSVNSAFSDLTAQTLFQKVYFATLEDSIYNLVQIAKHPVLRLHVKTIVFLTNMLDLRYSTYERWSSDVRVMMKTGLNSLPINPNQYFERFKELLTSQKAMVANNSDSEALSLAVTRCPNLQTIKTYEHLPYTTYAYDNAEETPVPIVSRLQQATLLEDPFYRHFGPFDLGDRSLLFPGITRATISLTRAISQQDTSRCLQEIDIDAIPWCSQRNGLKILCLPEHRDFSWSAFQNIRVMKLHFCMGGLRMNTVAQPLVQQTVSFLQAAANVEYLQLDFHRVYNHCIIKHPSDWFRFAAEMSDVLSRVTWPKLAELSLSRCSFTASAFIDFMERHRRQLRSLEARLLVLRDPENTWQTALQTLAPVMSFNSVHLERLLDSEIKTYVDEDEELNEEPSIGSQSEEEDNEEEGAEGDNPLEASSAGPEGPTVREMWDAYDRGASRYLKSKGLAKYPSWS